MIFGFGGSKKSDKSIVSLSSPKLNLDEPDFGWLSHIELLLGLPSKSLTNDVPSLMSAINKAEDIGDNIIANAYARRNSIILQSHLMSTEYNNEYTKAQEEFDIVQNALNEQFMVEVKEIEAKAFSELKSIFDEKNTCFNDTINFIFECVTNVDLDINMIDTQRLQLYTDNIETETTDSDQSRLEWVSYDRSKYKFDKMGRLTNPSVVPSVDIMESMFGGFFSMTSDHSDSEIGACDAHKLLGQSSISRKCLSDVGEAAGLTVKQSETMKCLILRLRRDLGNLVGLDDIADVDVKKLRLELNEFSSDDEDDYLVDSSSECNPKMTNSFKKTFHNPPIQSSNQDKKLNSALSSSTRTGEESDLNECTSPPLMTITYWTTK